MKDTMVNFDLKKEASALCYQVTMMLYDGAPKKKVASKVFYDYVEISYFIAVCNTLVSTLEFMKQASKVGWTIDELIGALQVDLKNSWDFLSRHRLGIKTFSKMSLENIINANSPDEYLNKSMMLPKNPNDENSLRNRRYYETPADETDVEKLQAQVRKLTREVEEWKYEYDILKARYEAVPEVGENSEE